ncbi:MAG: Trk system potassium transporter TrkA [Eubacteriales bacterium]|nr:Trk system potassium transporter TrkA [Eubacteriales bacterium]
MKIIIAGAGRIGSSLAEVLCREGHDISVVDHDPDTIDHISSDADVICLEGSVTDSDTLAEAGAEHADLLIASAQSDEVNLVCGISAKKLGTKHVIARVRDPQYLGKTQFLQDTFGISLPVNPEQECAKEISRVLRFPGASRVDSFSKGSAEIAEYRVSEDSPLNGLAVKDMHQKIGARVLVSLVERSGDPIIPNGQFVFNKEDRLSITGAPDELRKFLTAVGAYTKPVKTVIIMGGGKIAVYLTRILCESGMSVSVIEEDRDRCDALCELIPNARIICGDATKSEVLLEEKIHSADAFIALTGDDGKNIITSLYANSCGVGKTVVKVNHEHFAEMIDDSPLSSIIIPKEVVMQQIIRYVRALNNSADSCSIETLYKLADGAAEAIEFKITEDMDITGIPLKDLKLKPNVLIAGIIRNNKYILPDGASVIMPGDHAVVVTTSGWLKDINNIIR